MHTAQGRSEEKSYGRRWSCAGWISQLRLPTNPDDEFHVKNPTNDWQPGCSHAHYSESGHARVRNGAQSSAHSEERPEKVEPGLRQELIQKQQRTTIYC